MRHGASATGLPEGRVGEIVAELMELPHVTELDSQSRCLTGRSCVLDEVPTRLSCATGTRRMPTHSESWGLIPRQWPCWSPFVTLSMPCVDSGARAVATIRSDGSEFESPSEQQWPGAAEASGSEGSARLRGERARDREGRQALAFGRARATRQEPVRSTMRKRALLSIIRS